MKTIGKSLLIIAVGLLVSSCLPLKVFYWVYEVSQSTPVPQHELEENSEYEIIWNVSDITVPTGYGSGMVGAPGRIIVFGWKDYGFPAGKLLGLDSINGEVIWTAPGESGAKITTHGDILYRGTSGTATVQAYSTENGDSLWTTWLPLAHSVVTTYYVDNKIFVQSDDFDFYVLTDQGKIIDHFVESDSTYLEIDGILYMSYFEDGDGIQAVDYSSREVIWRVKQIGLPIFNNGTIFLANSTGVHSINQTTGNVNWTSPQNVLSNLCIMDEKIYFISEDSSLVALERETGEKISEVKISPSFDFDKQGGGYFVAGDSENNVLAVTFGDNDQIMGLRLINP